MSVEDPAIITCSISGAIANRDQCPAIPYTPAEYAAEARRIVDEGGVHIHIHARRPDGTPSYEVEDFLAIRDAICGEVGDAAIVNFSTGTVGVPVEKRIAYLEAGRPAVAALNMGSLNYAKYSRSRKDFVFKFVFVNPFDEIIELLEAMGRLRIKPEHECFDVGHVGSLEPLVDMGLLQAPLHADFVMGVTGGIPATARNLAVMAENLHAVGMGPSAGEPQVRLKDGPQGHPAAGEPQVRLKDGPQGHPNHHWGVIGIGRIQWTMVAAALTLGGSIRVGLEDNFYLPGGEMARSNGELIAKARQMTEDCGRRPATVQEARTLLGIEPPPPEARAAG
jgi:3-keto-5-aminohexanoate cleavage enzyme